MDPWQLRPARDHGLAPGERFASTRREPGLAEWCGQQLSSALIASYLRVWHRLAIEGREHVPLHPPFVLVANHTSHLDALVLTSLVPRRVRAHLYPIAAGDVFFETPPRALLSALLLNALPMRRQRAGRHALDDLRARLCGDPCAFVLFPEGTRSPSGEMQAFKAGLGMLIAGTDVPVVPCHLDGAFAAWPRTARWPRPRRLRVRIGAPLRFADVADDRGGWLQIATQTADAVRRLGDPISPTAVATAE
jgi:1-acyl-sn-glycerol-3-phosphate acyltransferase